MNILHLKYAVEVAKAGSLSKAAEALYMNQPNLSRAIKELEASLGITIFGRSAKGVYVTPEGEEFLGYARKILSQIDEVEAIYKSGAPVRQRFSISVPRASYISAAFAQFSKRLGPERAEIFYKETNAMRVIRNILTADYKLGILRYASNYDKYFKEMLDEKGLTGELVTEFHYVLLMNEKHWPVRRPSPSPTCGLSSRLPTPIPMCPRFPWPPSKRRSCPTISIAASSCLSGPASTTFCSRTPKPSCGCRPRRRIPSGATAWCSAPAPRIKRCTAIC